MTLDLHRKEYILVEDINFLCLWCIDHSTREQLQCLDVIAECAEGA
jgi:hypothetical protein